jgi:hypothetical protein
MRGASQFRWNTFLFAHTAGKKFQWSWTCLCPAKPTSKIAKYAAIRSRSATRSKAIRFLRSSPEHSDRYVPQDCLHRIPLPSRGRPPVSGLYDSVGPRLRNREGVTCGEGSTECLIQHLLPVEFFHVCRQIDSLRRALLSHLSRLVHCMTRAPILSWMRDRPQVRCARRTRVDDPHGSLSALQVSR